MHELLEIAALGPLTIRRGDQPITGFASRKVEALLVYLACTRRAHVREVVAELLWEDHDQERASANLRMALTSLRKPLEPYVLATRQTVALNPEMPCWLDVAELEVQLDAAETHWLAMGTLSRLHATRLEKALALYRGAFLEEFYLADNRSFEAWATTERERLRRRVTDAFHRLIAWHIASGAFHMGLQKANRLLQIDPLSEEAHRQMMVLLARTGQRHAALAQYDRCCQQLADELGVEPMDTTTALYEQIRAGTLAPANAVAFSTGSSPTPIQNPYKGLQAFQEADTPDFFGRERLIQQFLEQLTLAADVSPFLAVVGPSGSGKSSVVRAGLIPALRTGKLPGWERWTLIEMLPGPHPLTELERALRPLNPTIDLREQLRHDERGLIRTIQQLIPMESGPCLLLIDQFEEVFALVEDETARAHFLNSLYAAITEPGSRLRVIITLRADFYDRPLLYPGFSELVRSRTALVLPLAPEELEQVIVNPAARAGASVEPELVTQIIADVSGQPGTLPLLEYALTELFERREGQTLTLQVYRAIGGVAGAITRRADALYDQLDIEGQVITRQIFLRLITLGDGVEDTRRRVRKQELLTLARHPQQVEVVLNTFAKYRLLTLDQDTTTGSATVEVAHEALLRTWERLHEWIRQSREDLGLHRRLATAMMEWVSTGHDSSFLANGTRLEQFETWQRTTDLALNQEERAYLDASILERQRRDALEQQRQVREAQIEKRARTVLRLLVAVLLTATLGAFTLMTIANRNAAESQNTALIAGSQAALAKGDTDLALALAMQAVTLNPTSTPAQVALGQAAYAPGTMRRFTGHTTYVTGVAFSPDGHTIVSASQDKTLLLWDVATGALIRRFGGLSPGETTPDELDVPVKVSFSPDGRTILSGSWDRTLILWDAATGAMLRRFEGHTARIEDVTFSPDGRTILSGSQDRTLILWDAATGSMLHRFAVFTEPTEVNGGYVGGVFSPDGRIILSCVKDHLIVWDATTGAMLRRFSDDTGLWSSAAISPDGRYALTTTSTSNLFVYLWDMATGRVIRRFAGHTSPATTAVFSPDGHYAVSGAWDNTLIVWDVETGQTIHQWQGHEGDVVQVVFSPDGHHVASASNDKTVRVWDLWAGQIMQRFVGHTNFAIGVAFSPDGHSALSASWDKTAILWDVQTGKEVRRYTASTTIWYPAISPDGRTAFLPLGGIQATGPNDIVVWNMETGQEIRRLVGHQRGVFQVALSQDGRSALSGSGDGSMILWNVQTGQMIRRFVDRPNVQVVVVSLGPDSHLAVSGAMDGIVTLWDVASGQPIRHFEGIDGIPVNLTFSRDGQMLLGSGGNGTLLWDVATGGVLHRFIGHSAFVEEAALSPDEHLLFAGAQDGTSILWDEATGTILRRFIGRGEGADVARFSPDGHSVIIGFSDGRVELWRIDSSRDELLAWTHANRYIPELTCSQRQLYRLTPVCDTPTSTPFPATAPSAVTQVATPG